MEFIENVEAVVEIFASLVDCCVVFVYMFYMCGNDKKKKKRWIYIIGSFLCTSVVSWFICNTVFTRIIICVLAFLYAVYEYEGGITRKAILSIFGLIIMEAMDVLNFIIFSGIFGMRWHSLLRPGTSTRAEAIIMSKFWLLPMTVLILKKFSPKIKINRGLKMGVSISLLCYLASVIVMNIGYKNTLSDLGEMELLLIMLILLFFCIANGYTIIELNYFFGYKCENKVLNIRLNDQKDMLARIDSMYEDASIIRHDVKHYFTLITNLLEMNDYEKAKRIAYEALGHEKVFLMPVKFAKSNVINILLNEKKEMCKNQEIAFDIQVVGDIPLEYEMDITIILSNLIDNAIEAEQNMKTGRIELSMSEHKGMYCITVKNLIETSVLRRNPKLETTKNDKEKHGFGIKSIKKQVANMDGYYECVEEENYFVTNITIPTVSK